MKVASVVHSATALALVMVRLAFAGGAGGARFSSHVRVRAPGAAYSHGVGRPLPLRPQEGTWRGGGRRGSGGGAGGGAGGAAGGAAGGGYPRVRPRVPFRAEELPAPAAPDWQQAPFQETESALRVVPASPYRVDSADPESLWPAGLFLPPLRPRALAAALARRRHSQGDSTHTEWAEADPYVLAGAAAARRGPLYWHEVPHDASLRALQRLRRHLGLQPHRLGSLRPGSPYYRP